MNKKIFGGLIIIGIIIFLAVFFLVFADRRDGSNKKIHLDIDCNGKEISGEYKKGDSFKCISYTIKIDKINKDVAYLEVNKYGLITRNDDGSINLIANEKEFKLEKDKELELVVQEEDSNNEIKINWKDN